MRSALRIDPGRFRTELVLEEVSDASDGMGGEVETWSAVATVFAGLEPVSARSVFAADQTLETVTHLVTLRQEQDIRSGMRFAKGARVFDILTVYDPDETGRYFICETRETGR
ncbi:MAG: phage head closure protein [Rhizobiaceae bacterium]